MDRGDQALQSSLERLSNANDAPAKNALNRVLESWQTSEQQSARINIPVLLENRIEILRQAVLELAKH
jgi:hypothetical protein